MPDLKKQPPVQQRRKYVNSSFQHDLMSAKSEASPGTLGREQSLPWRTEESSNMQEGQGRLLAEIAWFEIGEDNQMLCITGSDT